MIDEYESRRIQEDIRRVLMEIWDPIGVKDEPNAKNEYDSYVGKIYTLLANRTTDDQIVEHLLGIVCETMGLEAATRDDMSDTLRALRLIPLPIRN